MKRVLTLLAIVILALATDASAAAPKSKGSNFFRRMETGDYNRFYLSYGLTWIGWPEPKVDVKKSEFPFLYGLNLGYLHASNIAKGIPLYIEYGASFQYTFGNNHIYQQRVPGSKTKDVTHINMYSVNVPINLTMRFTLSNRRCSLSPYVGINLRANLGGDKRRVRIYDFVHQAVRKVDRYRLFDSSDEFDAMGEKALKRFQPGVNFGLGFTYGRFYVGAGCLFDVMDIIQCEEGGYVGKFGIANISVGVTF